MAGENTNSFSVWDYVVFALMLLVSTVIGVYYAFGGKQTNTKEYLMAGRNMSWFPLFVSLLASYLSAITLLGVPSEIYTYGVQYICLILSYPIVVTCAAVIYAPIFYRLRVTSSNEYLERRFTPGVRSLGCGLVMLQYTLYLAVVLYAPSLALEAVAGIPLSATIISTGLVCTFYTTLGGMKAVIWTDVFQAAIMVLGLIVVMIVGAIELNGFTEVFKRAKEGERLNVFNFDPDPRVRNTFWTLSIGGAFTAMPVWTVSQPAVQRFCAAKSLRETRKALYANIPGLIFIVLLCVMDGLVVYAVYANCDLSWNGNVSSNDQILPYFIIHKLGHLKGVPGVFTACLFSGALSTASSGLNSIAAVSLEDIIKKIKPDLDDRHATIISKTIACVFGLGIVGLAFLVSFIGTMVLQLAYSIFGIIGGPYLGLFALGMLVPWSNWKGAYSGVVVGVACTLWLAIGAQIYPPNRHPALIRVGQCSRYNGTAESGPSLIRPAEKYVEPDTSLSSWYSISYLWYAAIGISFTFVSGCIFSLVFRNDEDRLAQSKVDPELLFDYEGFFCSFVPPRWRPTTYNLNRSKRDDDFDALGEEGREKAMELVYMESVSQMPTPYITDKTPLDGPVHHRSHPHDTL